MLRWAPRFFTDVTRFSPGDFYPAFAELAGAPIEEDRELLADIACASGIALDAAEGEADHA